MPAKLDNPLSLRINEALDYALNHHREDARKGGQIPYAAHLLGVCSIVMEMEVSEDEAIAGLLYDVIEDGGGPKAEAEIRDRFGDGVAEMVLANSDSRSGSSDKEPWRDRKVAYVEGIATKDIRAVRAQSRTSSTTLARSSLITGTTATSCGRGSTPTPIKPGTTARWSRLSRAVATSLETAERPRSTSSPSSLRSSSRRGVGSELSDESALAGSRARALPRADNRRPER